MQGRRGCQGRLSSRQTLEAQPSKSYLYHLQSFDFESTGELILSNVDLDGSSNGLDFEVVNDPLLRKAPMPILLNGGFDGKSTDSLSGEHIDGFVSSRHFCLHGLAPLVNYESEYAIY